MKELRCPYCNSIITPTLYKEVLKKIKAEEKERFQKLRAKLEIEIREHYAKHFEKQRKEIEKARKLIEESRKRLKLEEKELREKTRERLEKTYRKKEEDLRKKYEEIEAIRKKLEEDRKRARELARKEAEMIFKTRLEAEKNRFEKMKRDLEEKESRFKSEKQELIVTFGKREEKLKEKIEDLKAQLERKTLEELGTIPEEQLFDILRKEFPMDDFERIPRGRAGADIIQTVRYNSNVCGKILYESKNAKVWQGAWIKKIKSDGATMGTLYAILVTRAFPKGVKHFGIVRGVLVVNRTLLPHLAKLVRGALVAIERQKLSAFERERKISELFVYLDSDEFKSSVRAISESLNNLNELRMNEKRQHEITWSKEEKEVDNINRHFSKIVGNVETIIVKERRPIKILVKKEKQ